MIETGVSSMGAESMLTAREFDAGDRLTSKNQENLHRYRSTARLSKIIILTI